LQIGSSIPIKRDHLHIGLALNTKQQVGLQSELRCLSGLLCGCLRFRFDLSSCGLGVRGSYKSHASDLSDGNQVVETTKTYLLDPWRYATDVHVP